MIDETGAGSVAGQLNSERIGRENAIDHVMEYVIGFLKQHFFN